MSIKKFEEFGKVNEDKEVNVIEKFMDAHADEYSGKFDELINDFYVEFEGFCEEKGYKCKTEDIQKALKDITSI